MGNKNNEKIKKLKELYDEGILTEEEYQTKKEDVLNEENKKVEKVKTKTSTKIGYFIIVVGMILIVFFNPDNKKTSKNKVTHDPETTQKQESINNNLTDEEEYLEEIIDLNKTWEIIISNLKDSINNPDFTDELWYEQLKTDISGVEYWSEQTRKIKAPQKLIDEHNGFLDGITTLEDIVVVESREFAKLESLSNGGTDLMKKINNGLILASEKMWESMYKSYEKVTGENIRPRKVQQDFEVLEQEVILENNIPYISGRVKNNTNKNYSYVQVNINLYNENGDLITTTFDNVNNLESGNVWNFKAMIYQDTDNINHYKIVDITGF